MSKDGSVSYQTTLHVRDHCLCLFGQRAARALARRFDEALRPVGLKSGQFSILISLNRPEPPSIGSVASLLAMDRTTLTANLKPLERSGFLKIVIDEHDRRTRRLKLTDAGRKILAAALPIWNLTHANVESELGPDTAVRLRTDLNALA